MSRADQQQMLDLEETGLQEHSDENCLYCVGLKVLGCSANNSSSTTPNRPGQSPCQRVRPLSVAGPESRSQRAAGQLSCCTKNVSITVTRLHALTHVPVHTLVSHRPVYEIQLIELFWSVSYFSHHHWRRHTQYWSNCVLNCSNTFNLSVS